MVWERGQYDLAVVYVILGAVGQSETPPTGFRFHDYWPNTHKTLEVGFTAERWVLWLTDT